MTLEPLAETSYEPMTQAQEHSHLVPIERAIRKESVGRLETWRGPRRCTSLPFPCRGISTFVIYMGICSPSHLVDLGPTVFDARNVVQRRAVLPEWTLLDIEDECDGGEIHVCIFVQVGRFGFCRATWWW
jgi:hypothetical protein